MNSIVRLKSYNAQDLLHLLRACAQNLAMAYQEIPEKSLFLTAQEASRACDFLLYALHKQQASPRIH